MRRVTAFALFVTIGVLVAAPAGADLLAFDPNPAEVPWSEFGRGEVAITMKSTATSAQRRVVVRRIAARLDVIRWVHSSKDGHSYVLDLLEDASDLAGVEIKQQFERLPGVHDVYVHTDLGDPASDMYQRQIEDCPGFDHNVVVMMTVDSWDIQKAAVATVLDRDPRTALVRTVDPETKLAALRARYPNRFPDMAVRHLATSFEISVPVGSNAGIIDELESLGGVDEVVSTSRGCDALTALEANPD